MIPAISENFLSRTSSGSFPSWNLSYNNLLLLDDSYVWTAIKYYYQTLDEKLEISKICYELLSRKYKYSLYKSLVEYDLLYEEFSYEEKMLIKSFFVKNIKRDFPYVISVDQITAGYVGDYIVNELKKYVGLENIENLVYVDASYSSKRINVNNTFIKMQDDKLAPVSEIPLLADRVTKVGNTNQYFYLYFETQTTDTKKIKMETDLIKKALISILKKNIAR